MADFAPARGAHRFGLAHRVGREVVVMEVGLLRVGVEIVHLLGIAGCAQGCGRQHLREAALEQARAMHSLRQHAGGRADRTHLIETSAVNTLAVLDDLLTHQLLGQGFEAGGQCFAVA